RKPTERETAAAVRPIARDSGVAATTRAKRSRPRSSVPKKCAAEGGSNRSSSRISLEAVVASGEAAATIHKTTTTTGATRPDGERFRQKDSCGEGPSVMGPYRPGLADPPSRTRCPPPE